MPVAISHDAHGGIIETRFGGILTPDELRAAFDGMVRLARERGCWRFLSDCPALAGGHSAFDQFDLVESLVRMRTTRILREALVIPASGAASGNVAFRGAACRSRGIEGRSFSDRAQALAWLVQA